MQRAKATLLVWAAVIAIAGSGAAACSFILNFDEESRPCAKDSSDSDTLGDCLSGYSCMVNICVKNGSVPEGVTCSVTAHCHGGHVCTTAPFVCRKDCNQKAYGDNNDCGSTMACVRKTDPDGNATGACVPTECTTNADCTSSDGTTKSCVTVTSNVGVCEEACSINCSGGVCNNDCGFDDDRRPLACQPLGINKTLACIPEGNGSQNSKADPCNMVDALCDSDHACVMKSDGSFGVCLKYCDASNPTPCDGLIDPKTVAQAVCNVIPGKGYAICGQLPDEPVVGDDGSPGGDPAPGDPGGPTAGPYCQEACDNTPQCNASFECQSNRCVYVGCTTDDACNALYSGWTEQGCSTDAECSSGFGFCVNFASATYCVMDGSSGCTAPAVSINLIKVDGGATVQVCGRDTYVCGNDGFCSDPCTGNSDCTAAPYLICDAGTCVECVGNSDCSAGPKTQCIGSICRCNGNSECVTGTDPGTLCMPSGQCGCIDGTECTGTLTTCDAGVCVCSDGAECTDTYSGDLCTGQPSCGCSDAGNDCNATRAHPGTTWVCE